MTEPGRARSSRVELNLSMFRYEKHPKPSQKPYIFMKEYTDILIVLLEAKLAEQTKTVED